MQHIIDINKFKEVAPQMLWRGAAADQIDKFEKAVIALAKRFRVEAAVVGSHSSKSIDLPVIMLSTDVGMFTLRDNFHDINLMAILKDPASLTLDQFYADIQTPTAAGAAVVEINTNGRGKNHDHAEHLRVRHPQ
jgi:hypothetical protein